MSDRNVHEIGMCFENIKGTKEAIVIIVREKKDGNEERKKPTKSKDKNDVMTPNGSSVTEGREDTPTAVGSPTGLGDDQNPTHLCQTNGAKESLNLSGVPDTGDTNSRGVCDHMVTGEPSNHTPLVHCPFDLGPRGSSINTSSELLTRERSNGRDAAAYPTATLSPCESFKNFFREPKVGERSDFPDSHINRPTNIHAYQPLYSGSTAGGRSAGGSGVLFEPLSPISSRRNGSSATMNHNPSNSFRSAFDTPPARAPPIGGGNFFHGTNSPFSPRPAWSNGLVFNPQPVQAPLAESNFGTIPSTTKYPTGFIFGEPISTKSSRSSAFD